MADFPPLRTDNAQQEGASVPELLATKLYIPPARLTLVARPRLLEQLSSGLEGKLILIAAPAGFGKTTLLADWLASLRQKAKGKRQKETDDAEDLLPFTFSLLPFRVAWLSLDAADNDPATFLRYLIAALQTIVPEIGTSVLALLQTPQLPPLDTLVTLLLNDATTLPHESLLILDDYQMIATPAIHEALAFLLDHMPPQLHLVIASREDPPLPLARLRARRQLAEIRAADLRFTPEEAAAFLNEVMGLRLSAEDIAALETRTEGWIAGLQLAALSLQGVKDKAQFIEVFSGSNRYIVDYLVEEVLRRQPEEVRAFLLQTSILEQLCGSLCDAVVDHDDQSSSGQAILEYLERANLFLIPLDDERKWYRYHHLFADALRARLVWEASATRVAVLHLRASGWFEQAELLPDAIQHALAAEAIERAADLIEQAAPPQFLTRVLSTLPSWLAALPAELIDARPRLALADAGRLIQAGETAAAEDRIDAAERALGPEPATERDRNTRGEAAAIRAVVALGRAEPEPAEVIALAERALVDLNPLNAHFRGVAGICLGSAALLQGDGQRAEAALAEATRSGRVASLPHLVLGAASYLAVAQRALGARRRALTSAREALAWIANLSTATVGRLDTLDLQLADLLREENDLGTAAAHADEAVAHFRRWGVQPKLCYSLLALARVHQAAGDLDGALAALDEARALSQGSLGASWAVLDACVAQIRLARGELEAALRWVEEPAVLTPAARPAPAILMVAYECEHQRIAPAQVWLAHGRAAGNRASIERALALLAEQQRAASALGLGWLRLKVSVLEALAHAALGDEVRALDLLGEVLALAEPEGYVRMFVDEGSPMAELLRAARQHGIALNYVAKLLAAFPETMNDERGTMKEELAIHRSSFIVQPLVEQLTPRELEVLQLLAAGASNGAIADALVISIGTAKKHVNNILGKLGVQSRTQAAIWAREHTLL